MSDSGHPSRFGYVQCNWCGCWRRQSEVQAVSPATPNGSPWLCVDQSWCVAETRRRALPTREAMLAHYSERRFSWDANGAGWDANGAPTGVDSNGDAT